MPQNTRFYQCATLRRIRSTAARPLRMTGADGFGFLLYRDKANPNMTLVGGMGEVEVGTAP